MDARSDTSSPDPLGYPGNPDYILSSATKPFFRRQSTFSPRKSQSPTRRQSPIKLDPRSAQSIKFQDIILPSTPSGRFIGKHRLSPTKKATLHSVNNTSPWRIRVTVEAKQDEENENVLGSVRSGARSGRSGRTTKVPLKDENDSLEPSPKRQRTGKSNVSQRVPTPRKRRSRIEAPSGSTDTVEKKTRGRPRKSLPSVEEGPSPNKFTFADSVRKKMAEADPFFGLAMRDNGTNDNVVDNIPPDISNSYSESEFPDSIGDDRSSPTPNENSRSKITDLLSRKMSPIPNHHTHFPPFQASSRISTGLSPENTIDAGHTPGPQLREYPTPTSSSILEEGAGENLTHYSSGAEHTKSESVLQPLSDPTTHHREFDSILESEGFSMVSLDTLPSARQHLNNSFRSSVSRDMVNSMEEGPKKVDLSASKSETTDVKLSMSGERMVANGHLLYSDQPHSMSQLAQQGKKSPRELHQTPGVRFSSPHQPTALPIQSAQPLRKRRLVKLVRVVRAGIALQGVLDRRRRNSRLQTPFSSPSQHKIEDPEAVRQRVEALFQGLGAETERELRAGLRFGEELAKHLRESKNIRQQERERTTEKHRDPNAFEAGGSNDVSYPNIGGSLSKGVSPSPAKSHTNSEFGVKVAQLTTTPSDKNQSPPQSISSEMARREAEWQREREAVSRQIQQANSSQVIVIDSDDESPEKSPAVVEEPKERYENDPIDEEDYEDIWQQEARDADSHSEPDSLLELSREEIIKQPRRLLPSPWKHHQDAELSQDEDPTPQFEPYWKARQNGYPILPSGKTQTARFREQSNEISSLMGSPGSSTRRFYEENNRSPENVGTPHEQPFKGRQARETVSSPITSAPGSRTEKSYSEGQQSDAGTSDLHWVPSPKDYRNDTGHTNLDDVDTHPGQPIHSDLSYAEVLSASVNSPRKDPEEEAVEEAEEEMHPESGSPTSTPRAPQYDHVDPNHSAIHPESPPGSKQETPPSSWFHKLTDLAPKWLTPSSRKTERRNHEPVYKYAPVTHNFSVQLSPNEESPLRESPIDGYLALESPAQTSPASEPSVQEPLVHQRLQEHIKKSTVDVGTQFSSPRKTEPKPQMKRQPSYRKALAISGYFTDDHYVALRHLYHQAKQFPDSFPYIETPERNEMLGKRMYSADGAYSRQITETQIAIVDKFRRNLVIGSRRRGGTGRIEWSEEELLRRLFSIIIGEHVRRERKRDLQRQLAN
ncbi:hypothetical protein PAAG_02102 [Paracoccidioides lutzii Pb01]|uniref:AT DNA binding protein n=1 Tax=Paracoccidioides lutzii (strain ATCC MYA-826 / Pb01) TaxID=502779 RepID=C1GUA7_PARBA|nr:hypothetical protein PAAG_02102 [Paracoccidioides lutzii Pb01]EEH39913.1 hypothetical protein PAAG_02102 [Paracoccidioides lutzii Pb01]